MKRIVLACLVALAPVATWANIIPTGTSITGAGPYVWTYNLQLSSDQDAHSGPSPTVHPVPHVNLNVGSFLTLFDFAGYVTGSCTGPAGWTCTNQDIGFTPDDVIPTDDAALPNLTWVYENGPKLTGEPNGLDLGLFSATSIYNREVLVSYAARGVKNNGFSIGTIADNVGNTRGPGQAVPEPGTLTLAGLALVLSGGLMKRRRNR